MNWPKFVVRVSTLCNFGLIVKAIVEDKEMTLIRHSACQSLQICLILLCGSRFFLNVGHRG